MKNILTMILMTIGLLVFGANALLAETFGTPGNYTYDVQFTRNYTISLRGADGGNGNFGSRGGSGAAVTATFALQAGDQLTIVVGGVGQTLNGGGGGGGSAVILNRGMTQTLLIVAGGGGGAGWIVTNGTPINGLGGSSADGTAGGGTAANGGGGGGFNAAGQNNGATGGGRGGGAATLSGGGTGGSGGSLNGGDGGFGFGGGGEGSGSSGGGGGGFGGGDGGNGFGNLAAGGGSSLVAAGGTNVTRTNGTTGGTTQSNGSVVVNGPTTLTVTKAADTNDNSCDASDCSLREAIAAAQAGDIIEFASPLFDTAQEIQINGQLVIDKSLTINGRGAKLLTVRNVAPASGTSRVFLITTGTIKLSGMTITGGNLTNGGAFFNCFGQAVCGGGIANGGDLTITDSVITGNTANSYGTAVGGGIINVGTLTITGTTISNNSAVGSNAAFGGGINVQSGVFKIANSTVSGNRVISSSSFAIGGGIITSSSPNDAGTVNNVTITNNSSTVDGGGIAAFEPNLNIRNSIVSGNTAPYGPEVYGILGANENNLIGGDARLMPLSDNGGPTPTHALMADSPAINAGNNCVTDLSCSSYNPPFALTTDQRGAGFARLIDTTVDIGAYEITLSDSTPPVITPTVTGTLGNNGWYTSNVEVSWSVVDDESTVSTQTGCTTQTVTTDTASLTLTCSATSAGGSDSQSVTVKRDATAPVLNPSVSPNPVLLGGTATASANAADSLSGVASESCDATNTATVGSKTVSCTATDNAGNTASASASYRVIFNFAGFFQPVDNLPTVNVASVGQAIPLKFSLTGNQGLAIFAAGYPASGAVPCSATDPSDVVTETVNAGGSSLTYDAATDQYSYVWKTEKAWKGSCRILVVRLADGTDHLAKFRFR